MLAQDDRFALAVENDVVVADLLLSQGGGLFQVRRIASFRLSTLRLHFLLLLILGLLLSDVDLGLPGDLGHGLPGLAVDRLSPVLRRVVLGERYGIVGLLDLSTVLLCLSPLVLSL